MPVLECVRMLMFRPELMFLLVGVPVLMSALVPVFVSASVPVFMSAFVSVFRAALKSPHFFL